MNRIIPWLSTLCILENFDLQVNGGRENRKYNVKSMQYLGYYANDKNGIYVHKISLILF